MPGFDPTREVIAHYHRSGLTEIILEACAQAGKDPAQLTRDDLTVFDEFHIGGRRATRRLAAAAGLAPGTRVLDLGCGVGGPARTLAAEFGCMVTGIDIVPEYCRAATELTRRVGLTDRAQFQVGDAQRIPCDDESFDVVITQHVIMNVPAKERLTAEVHRTLIPGGAWLPYEVFRGVESPPHFPLPWADDPVCSHLVSVDEFRSLLVASGFRVRSWNDVTPFAHTWFASAASRMLNWGSAPPPLAIHLLMGQNTLAKARNMVRNLAENRIVVCEGALVRA